VPVADQSAWRAVYDTVTLRTHSARTANVNTLPIIKELAAKQFGGEPDTIDENAAVDQLGIDSLGFLEFLFELEDKLGVAIPQDAVKHVRTLCDLATVTDGLVAAKPPATPA